MKYRQKYKELKRKVQEIEQVCMRADEGTDTRRKMTSSRSPQCASRIISSACGLSVRTYLACISDCSILYERLESDMRELPVQTASRTAAIDPVRDAAAESTSDAPQPDAAATKPEHDEEDEALVELESTI